MHNSLSVKKLQRISQSFLITLGLLLIVGVIMVYSASYIYAKEIYHDSSYFLLRQLFFVVFGGALAYGVARINFSFFIKNCFRIHGLAFLAVVLTLIPGVGLSVKGASRWLNIGFFNLQPAEFLKFTSVLCAAIFFENFSMTDRREKIVKSLMLLVPVLILIAQPDFGTFSIIFFSVAFCCFVSSFPRRIFFTTLFSGIVFSLCTLFLSPYRVQRLLGFLNPWENPRTSGFQIIQSYLAFASGAFWGQGMGNSNEKLFYLPEAHNDFIFSVIGEELGFVGVFLLIMAFIVFTYFGLKISLSLTNKLSVIVSSSIIFTISLQALVNMGVVLGLLPTKGLNLPFVSYGGSSLMANFFAIGILFSAVRKEVLVGKSIT